MSTTNSPPLRRFNTPSPRSATGKPMYGITNMAPSAPIVKPTSSFRSSKGQICRHIHLLLNSGQYSKKSEGVACRTARGIWSLEG